MAAAHLASFEDVVIPHYTAAYKLAAWITRGSHEAEDLAQEACMKAYRGFSGFRGIDGRAWLLAIVRNTCLSWLRKTNSGLLRTFDEDLQSGVASPYAGPEQDLLNRWEARILCECLQELPPEYREVLLLREIEEMSYKQIAAATRLPLGTIMSRLSRARKRIAAGITAKRHRAASSPTADREMSVEPPPSKRSPRPPSPRPMSFRQAGSAASPALCR